VNDAGDRAGHGGFKFKLATGAAGHLASVQRSESGETVTPRLGSFLAPLFKLAAASTERLVPSAPLT
jgi:hypothetical protein